MNRAYQLIEQLEASLEPLRAMVQRQFSAAEAAGTSARNFWGALRTKGVLLDEIARQRNDVLLASAELDCARAIDPDATIETPGGAVSELQLRAALLFQAGRMEMVAGTSAAAKDYFLKCLELTPSADAHFMLGLAFQSEYAPVAALKHFERCLELDPDGALGVAALREADAMRHYRKQFRGDWGTAGLLLLFCLPLGVLYLALNYK